MKTFEEVREILAIKFSKERKRLKSFGTKIDSFQMANAVTRHVLSLMCDSRRRELVKFAKMLSKKRAKYGDKKTAYYAHKILKERLSATSQMTKTLEKFADDTEKQRPYGYKGSTRRSKR